jgi:dihydroorotate dehydrogenase
MGYDLETMALLMDSLIARVGESQRLGLKLPPYISEEEKGLVPDLALILNYRKIFKYMVAANTIPNQIARHADGSPILSVPKGLGGLSGPATKEVGREQLRLWHQQIGLSMDIVSALGVDSGEEVGVRLSMGATAVEAATLLTESRNWPSTISSVLQDYANTVE